MCSVMCCDVRNSRSAWSSTIFTTSGLPRAADARQRGPVWRSQLSQQLHLDVASSRAVLDRSLRGSGGGRAGSVHAASPAGPQQHHGHREHLRAGRSTAVQRRGMGSQHSVLSRSTGDENSRELSVLMIIFIHRNTIGSTQIEK